MQQGLSQFFMTIIDASLENIPQIQRIAYATWPSAYGEIISETQIHYMLATMYSTGILTKQLQEGHHFALAESEGKAIGFAGYAPTEDSKVYKLHKLYVLPNIQKEGAGKALLHYAIDFAKNAGAEKLQLNVNRSNNAKNFYEKNGFQVIGEEDIDIGNGYFMNDYVMEFSLQ
ncbi:N-acetylglutamate synthase, GNAT family [Filimonas lacunae]|uniref:N-acetylglutamate synthase, GNAT family n=2 Tax=Filimonas lacunae TaxID=477680 RepID=A0A1N7R0M6_9BACT|nr:N-acetylglutamate synthase, GNAT family [Filimonas lacunae]